MSESSDLGQFVGLLLVAGILAMIFVAWLWREAAAGGPVSQDSRHSIELRVIHDSTRICSRSSLAHPTAARAAWTTPNFDASPSTSALISSTQPPRVP